MPPGLPGVCGCFTDLQEEAGSLGWKAVGGGYTASTIGTSGDIHHSKSFGLKGRRVRFELQLLMAS